MTEDFDALEHYKTQVRLLVWSGFFGEADLDDYMVDLQYDPDAKGITQEIENHARTELANKFEAEKEWPNLTDCDRLDATFQALENQRILALHNAGCTAQDAAGDAWEIIGREPKGTWEGFCYYHAQDVERAVQALPLFIGFDAVANTAAAKQEIGKRVVEALRAADFDVDWNNDPETRMSITNIDWKRRTPRQHPAPQEASAMLQAGPASGSSLGGWFRGLFG